MRADRVQTESALDVQVIEIQVPVRCRQVVDDEESVSIGAPWVRQPDAATALSGRRALQAQSQSQSLAMQGFT